MLRLYIKAENVKRVLLQKKTEIRILILSFERCAITSCGNGSMDETFPKGEMNIAYSTHVLTIDILSSDGTKKSLDFLGTVQISKKTIVCGFEVMENGIAYHGLVNIRLNNAAFSGYVVKIPKQPERRAGSLVCRELSPHREADFDEGFLFGDDHKTQKEKDASHQECAHSAPLVDFEKQDKPDPSIVEKDTGPATTSETCIVSDCSANDQYTPTDLQKTLLENASDLTLLFKQLETTLDGDSLDKPPSVGGGKVSFDDAKDLTVERKDTLMGGITYKPPTDCTSDVFFKTGFDKGADVSTSKDDKEKKRDKERRRSKERRHEKDKKPLRPHTIHPGQKRKSNRIPITKIKKVRESDSEDTKNEETRDAISNILLMTSPVD